jgi:hypothetical protein
LGKTGVKPKDSFLGDNFNRKKTGLSKEALAAARAASKEVTSIEKRNLDEKIQRCDAQIQKLRDKRATLMAQAGYLEEENLEASPSKMLDHMWKVFRIAGGLKRLQQVMKDDKEFRTMAKEMLKVEGTISRNKQQGTGQTTVFVVLKGLEEPPVPIGKEGSLIDLEQVKRSLDPEAMPYEEREQITEGPIPGG